MVEGKEGDMVGVKTMLSEKAEREGELSREETEMCLTCFGFCAQVGVKPNARVLSPGPATREHEDGARLHPSPGMEYTYLSGAQRAAKSE
jgi:hypothetical protein